MLKVENIFEITNSFLKLIIYFLNDFKLNNSQAFLTNYKLTVYYIMVVNIPLICTKVPGSVDS